MKDWVTPRIKDLVQASAHILGYEIHKLPGSIVQDRPSIPIAPASDYFDTYLLGRVHKKDQMFNGNAEHYVGVGLSAMDSIDRALHLAGKSFTNAMSCLDMPSGYGRVLRLLRLRINPSRIIACDIDEEAIKFCTSE